MKSTISEDIQKLFHHYEDYFQKKDFKSQAGLFSKDLMAAGPTGVIHHSNNFLSRFLFHKAMNAFYTKAQLTSVKILSLDESRISNEYYLVKVHWGAKFKKTGDQLIEYDISYLIQSIRGDLKIVLFIAHEDEMQALKRHGIIEK